MFSDTLPTASAGPVAGAPADIVALAEASPLAMFLTDAGRPENPLLYVNEAFTRLTGWTAEEVLGRRLPLLEDPRTDAAALERLAAAFVGGAPAVIDAVHHRKRGAPFSARLHLSPVRGAGGRVRHVFGVLTDTGERPVEHGGRDATLLRDFQHRVMNNLQYILSLMDMQARRSSSDEIRDAFRDLRARIDVLAEVYRLLYRDAGETHLDIGSYVGQLALNLSRFYDSDGAVSLSVDTVPVRLDLDQAFPAGLVVTELVVNAFKHAFDGTRPGRIAVRVELPAPGRLAVTVADNGPGLPPPEARDGKRLGMTIVHSLARQMGGSVEVNSEDGLSVTLTVPLPG